MAPKLNPGVCPSVVQTRAERIVKRVEVFATMSPIERAGLLRYVTDQMFAVANETVRMVGEVCINHVERSAGSEGGSQ